MMRKMLLTGIVASVMFTISSCDEDTASIGKTLTSNVDLFTIVSDTFDVSSKSLVVDAVLSNSTYGYLGRIKDPETSAYITSDYMTQFATLENAIDSIFYPKENVMSMKDGKEVADSCYISIMLKGFTGDSLASMKMTISELDRPIDDTKKYYTNFDPEAEGYIRTDGLKYNVMYSVTDMMDSDSVRNAEKGSYSINIKLDKPYKAKNGKEYDNYGTYLLQTYYEHPEYFKNPSEFTKNVCPGFYFKTTDGLGMMAEIETSRLSVFYRIMNEDKKEYNVYSLFYSTQEVLQTSHIVNDVDRIKELAEEKECTYLKTPAGIYTEVELPVDDIKLNHENDTITSAKIVFHKLNDKMELSEKLLKDPTTLLMVEKDSLKNFFEDREVANNITSFLATLSTTYNSYTFNNISSLINYLYMKKTEGGANFTKEHPNWNKVVLVPVQTTAGSTATTTVSAVNNEMSITSSRLVGGEENILEPIRISVIYNKTK
jgi:hypothetical protein